MLELLKEQVWKANLDLPRQDLVIFTWGNASGIDDDRERVVIKPSGVEYEGMRPEDMVVVDMSGNVIEGLYRPSSDLPTHLVLYRNFADCAGVVHTHSPYATTFAQAGLPLLPFGTTHADYFYGEIPCTRDLTEREITGSYEEETGNVIVETFRTGGVDPAVVPAVLVKSHGSFVWGRSARDAAEHAKVLEEIAAMNLRSLQVNPLLPRMNQKLLDKHYLRKHGENAYYGQKQEE